MANPVIQYTSKDFASLRSALLLDAQTKIPEWTSRSPNDFGVVLIEEFAYLGDILAYYVDRVANESYLKTATQRSSVLNIAQLLDYRPDGATPATVLLTIAVPSGAGTVTIPAGSQFAATPQASTLLPPIIFETDQDLIVTQDAVLQVSSTVRATEGSTIKDESVGTSSGMPLQVFSLQRRSAIDGSLLVYVNEGSGNVLWTFREHLIDAAAADRTYSTITDAYGVTQILFGDGLTGRIPPSGSVVTATYRTSLGKSGNVGARSINTVISAPSGAVSSVVNSNAATGGTDAESLDSIRVNAPLAASTLNRAVTLADYANLCLKVGTVAKAAATGLNYTAIIVAVAPAGADAYPSVDLKTRVLTFLEDKKMVNAHITITDPVYVPVLMRVTVAVGSAYPQDGVRQAVQNALLALIGTAKTSFGQKILASDLYQAAQSIQGVSSVVVTALSRNLSDTTVTDVILAPLEIPTPTSSVVAVTATGGYSPSVGIGGGGGASSVVPGAPGAPVVDSISCPAGTGYSGAYNLQIHWTAATNATSYGVILDFYNGATYIGSQGGGTYTGTTASISQGMPGTLTQVRIRVRAFNGTNFTDGAITSQAYTCGTNTP